MKFFFNFILFSLLISNAFANHEYRTTILNKSKLNGFKLVKQKVTLSGLLSLDKFENEFFKIVAKDSDKAIDLNDKDLSLRASTVYYFAHKAFNFWHLNYPQQVANLGQITIRIDLEKVRGENLINSMRSKPQLKEIWLGSMKSQNIEELQGFVIPTPLTDQVSGFRGLYESFFRSNMRRTTLEHIIYPEYASSSLFKSLFVNGSLLVLTNILFNNIHRYDRLVQGKKYHHDPAVIAESIISSINKLILINTEVKKDQDNLPVINGISDYFSTIILNTKKLNSFVDKFYYGSLKKRDNSKRYQLSYEYDPFNQQDFVLGLLWDIKKLFPIKADKLILNSKNYLSEDILIRRSLIGGILSSCEQLCDNPFVDKLSLLELFTKRGL